MSDIQEEDLKDSVVDDQFQPDEDHALTVFGGVLTIISTIVGGGIVGLPFAFYMLGLVPGLIFLMIMSAQTVNSVWLYLRAKDLIPGKPESLYEIGYILFQRKAIFMISAVLVCSSLGMCMIYFIIFGKTMGGIYGTLFIASDIDIETLSGLQHFMTHRTPYISILAACLLPVMLKKQLQELHIVSVGLFVAILIFVSILCFQLLFFGQSEFSKECDQDGHYHLTELAFSDILLPGANATFYNQIKSCVTAMVAFSFANNLFPVYSSLKVKTNANMANVSSIAIGLVFVIYTLLSIVCLFLFGDQISDGTNVMNSVNLEIIMEPSRKESFALQLLFMIVLGCHIPFIFFSGKEALCIIIDELDRRSISQTLDERIAFLNNNGPQDTGTNSESEGKENLITNTNRIGSNVTRLSNFGGRMGSIQSQIRSTLQQRRSTARGTTRLATGMNDTARSSRISVIRETQSLRRPPATIDEDGRKTRLTATGEYQQLGEKEDEGGLAYLDMKDKYYYGGSLFYFFLIVFGAIIIPSVDTIFEFVGAICINALSFGFPGSFYLFANSRYRSTMKGEEQKDDWKMKVSAYGQLILGAVALVLGMFSNIHGLVEDK